MADVARLAPRESVSDSGTSTAADVVPVPGREAASVSADVPQPPARLSDFGRPQDVIPGLVRGAVDRLSYAVQPEAAAVVASSFGFPLLLMLAVIGFLMLQGYLDRRDPKLRMAPRTLGELTVPWTEEADL